MSIHGVDYQGIKRYEQPAIDPDIIKERLEEIARREGRSYEAPLSEQAQRKLAEKILDIYV